MRKETNLENEEQKEIHVGNTLELFEKILWYECKDIVLGSRDVVILQY